MKTITRLALLLLAGLTLAGCASKQSADNTKPAATRTAAYADQPESGADHWMQRNLNDKFDRQRGQP